MSTQNKQNENQEIDLSMISTKLNEGFERFLSWLFRCFLFIKRNIIIIIILFAFSLYILIFPNKYVNDLCNQNEFFKSLGKNNVKILARLSIGIIFILGTTIILISHFSNK